MAVTGKGFMIWKIRSCENGNAIQIANEAEAAGFTHIQLKIADGTYKYNVYDGVDLAPAVVSELKRRNIQVWGWHYIYGNDPIGEARTAANRVQELGLHGYIIDAEVEFKLPGKDLAASQYMAELRRLLPNTPIGLSSFRFPALHPQFPWTEFLQGCDYNMPQVYWLKAHNPAEQLQRCVREFQSITPYRPIAPIGPYFQYGDWLPSEEEIIDFMDTCRNLDLPSASYFTWDYRYLMEDIWDAIASYPWGDTSIKDEIPSLYIDALNSGDITNVTSLYHDNAVHITSRYAAQGTSDLGSWFLNFINHTFPNPTFKLTGMSRYGNIINFTWTGTSSNGSINNGRDTFGLLNNKILYHYSNYSIT